MVNFTTKGIFPEMDSGISQLLLSTTSTPRIFHDVFLLLQEAPSYQWALLGMSGLGIGILIARVLYFRAEIPELVPDPVPELDPPGFQGWRMFGQENRDASVNPQNHSLADSFPCQPLPPPPRLVPPPPPIPPLPLLPGSMFTSTATSDRTAFIMDVSYSMNPDQLALSKEELKSAIVKLPPDSEYQVIFFSGTARFAHQSQAEAVRRAKDLPVEKWLKATPKNKKATLKAIDQVRKSRGTVWQIPIMLAMNLESSPDSIYFHTDGAKTSNTQLVDEIVTLVKQKGDGQTKIHTIALMAAKSKGAKYLQAIAEQTGGEYKLVSNTRFLRHR